MAETLEPINADQVTDFVDMVRSILPESEADPFIIEREDTGYDEDIIDVDLSAGAIYQVGQTRVHVEEVLMDVREVSAVTTETEVVGGRTIVTEKVHRVYPDDNATSLYTENTSVVDEKGAPLTEEELQRLREESIKTLGMRVQFDEKLGLTTFTEEKFDAIMVLLRACGPHNLLA